MRQSIVVLVVLMIAFGGVAAVGHNQRHNAQEHDRPFFHKVYNVGAFMFCMAAMALLLLVVQPFMNTD